MLKLLLKKQLAEVFRMYFYDAKKNKKRSTSGVIAYFILFAVLIVGVLGGISVAVSIPLCSVMTEAGVGWLYFIIMSGMAIILGAFGSVFNTFAGLYLSKDNDLLLSMPIPVKYIIASRLLNVYLLGAMYSVVVILPATVIYWLNADLGFMNGLDTGIPEIICGIMLILIITVIVLILSCLLGWCVAKISLKLKHKSFVTVLASLVFIGAYYFFYFKAQDLLNDLIANTVAYGSKIKGSSYILYLFGRMGEGDVKATLIFTAATAILLLLTWLVMKNTFISMVTSSGKSEKVKYVEKAVKQKSVFSSVLGKEFARFTSNPNYMLNCGLGVLLIPAIGVLLLIKGGYVFDLLESVFGELGGSACVLFCAALLMLSCMNDIPAPSVSLEGKNIWILQSMPVDTKAVLRAKASINLILTEIPMVFAVICACIVMRADILTKILFALTCLLFVCLYSVFTTFAGLKMANLTWTNEIFPIKQGGAVALSLFGSWAFVIAFAVIYMLIGYKIGENLYFALWSLLFAAVSAIILRWLDTKGAESFSNL